MSSPSHASLSQELILACFAAEATVNDAQALLSFAQMYATCLRHGNSHSSLIGFLNSIHQHPALLGQGLSLPCQEHNQEATQDA